MELNMMNGAISALILLSLCMEAHGAAPIKPICFMNLMCPDLVRYCETSYIPYDCFAFELKRAVCRNADGTINAACMSRHLETNYPMKNFPEGYIKKIMAPNFEPLPELSGWKRGKNSQIYQTDYIFDVPPYDYNDDYYEVGRRGGLASKRTLPFLEMGDMIGQFFPVIQSIKERFSRFFPKLNGASQDKKFDKAKTEDEKPVIDWNGTGEDASDEDDGKDIEEKDDKGNKGDKDDKEDKKDEKDKEDKEDKEDKKKDKKREKKKKRDKKRKKDI